MQHQHQVGIVIFMIIITYGLSLHQQVSPSPSVSASLLCHRRLYAYKVHQTDSEGRRCWDEVQVMSCWGRCDSNEISDWRFPYKRSNHPVCLHDVRKATTIELSNCDEGVSPGTEKYTVLEAVSCRCSTCKSSEASCEGLRYRGQRSGR